MAKVVGPLHSSEARGSVGSLTYNTWRGISIVKARVGPTIQYSDAQVAVRDKAAAATTSWQGLTDAQRDAWHDYALAHLDVDWTGNPQRLTGYNWYVRANVRAQLVDADIRESPPEYIITRRIYNTFATPIGPGLAIYWSHTPLSPPPELRIDIYGAGPHSPGRKPTIKQCRRIAWDTCASGVYLWEPLDPGLYTIFIRLIHTHGVVAGWHRITGTKT